MSRTLNLAVHTVRREAFVDAALRLMQKGGYERMSIQDLLDELDVSRGAFYHYFDSKQALLGAMVDRMADVALARVAQTVEDPQVPAPTKLERFFGGIAQWKTEQKALMLEFIKVWISDDNAVVREKVRRTTVTRVAPVLTKIVQQGIDEGVFNAESPNDTALVLMMLMQGFQDGATELFLARQVNAVGYDAVEKMVATYTQAFERILGAPAGSVRLVDENVMREWFG